MNPNSGVVGKWSATLVFVVLCIWCLAVVLSWYDRGSDAPPRHEYVDLNDKNWEGILWKDAEAYIMGLAVRERLTDGQERGGYTGWSVTGWGDCDPWSERSEGGYCLIRKAKLTDRGLAAIREYIEPDVAGALP